MIILYMPYIYIYIYSSNIQRYNSVKKTYIGERVVENKSLITGLGILLCFQKHVYVGYGRPIDIIMPQRV